MFRRLSGTNAVPLFDSLANFMADCFEIMIAESPASFSLSRPATSLIADSANFITSLCRLLLHRIFYSLPLGAVWYKGQPINTLDVHSSHPQWKGGQNESDETGEKHFTGWCYHWMLLEGVLVH